MPQDIIPRASNFVPETIVSGGLVDKIRVSGYNQMQAMFGFEFLNGLDRNVTVLLRTGVSIEVPRGNCPVNAFVIRTKYGSLNNVILDAKDLLNDTGRVTSREAELIAKAVAPDHTRYTPNNGLTPAVVDYLISRQDFDQYGGFLYLETLDLAITVHSSKVYALSHPKSLAGIRQQLIEETPELEQGLGLVYKIRIIDRHGRFGARFVNIGGEVFHIKAERNTDLPDGVYAVTNYPALGEQEYTTPRSQTFSFDDADKELHLYLTYKEALTLGNPQDVYKRELDERAHKLKLQDHEFQETKAQWQREADERKQEMERENHSRKLKLMEREEQVAERERQHALLEQDLRAFEQRLRNDEARIKRDTVILKEAYDNRAMDRKEVQEIVKHLPALIGGLAAIIITIKKLKG